MKARKLIKKKSTILLTIYIWHTIFIQGRVHKKSLFKVIFKLVALFTTSESEEAHTTARERQRGSHEVTGDLNALSLIRKQSSFLIERLEHRDAFKT